MEKERTRADATAACAAGMSSRERLLAAYRGGMADRTPVMIRGVYPFNDKWVARKHESYAPLIEYVRERTDIVDLCGLGSGFFLTAAPGMPAGSDTQEIDSDRTETASWVETPRGRLVRKSQYSRSQRLSMTSKFWIESDDDLQKFLSIPYVPVRPDLSDYFDRRARIGDRGIALPEISNAVSFVHDLLGSEALAIWSADRRGRVVELIELFNQRLAEYIAGLLDRDVGPVIGLLGEEYITPPMHAPRDFHEFVVPYDRRLVEVIHARGALCRIHCHGCIGRLLDGFLEIGVDALHPVEEPPMGDVTLAQFRRRVGDRICIKGGVQIGDLYENSADEVAGHCRRVIETAGAEGALILAPSASPYWPRLTSAMFDNYRAMIDSVYLA